MVNGIQLPKPHRDAIHIFFFPKLRLWVPVVPLGKPAERAAQVQPRVAPGRVRAGQVQLPAGRRIDFTGINFIWRRLIYDIGTEIL